MKRNSFKLTAILSLFIFQGIQVAHAADVKNETNITIDFQNRQIQFYGIYSPGKSNARAQGLEAEIVARRNGIAHLNTYLTRSCDGATAEKTEEAAATPSWQTSVKSQGSEIYSNGVLKISLVAPLKEVLKNATKSKSSTLKTKEGTPIALRLPRLPASALKCGMLNLTLSGRTIALNPLSGSTESGAKVVNLTLDGSSSVKPAGASDLALLENSNLMSRTDTSANDAIQQNGRPSDAATSPNANTSPTGSATTQPAN